MVRPLPTSADTPTLSVVIPTYLRPEWLRRSVRSLALQASPPSEVIAVAREDDSATLATIESLRLEPLPFPIVRGVVREPGFMPPVEEGIRLASGEIIAMLDDDGEAEPGWTAGLLRHYRDPLVGAAGGRYINMKGDVAVPVESTRRVGYVNSLGGFVGRMYLRPDFDDAVAVDFLMGGCMSYRATVARVLEFDRALNGDVAFGYEVDLGLQVRARGLEDRVRSSGGDPALLSAPCAHRDASGERRIDPRIRVQPPARHRTAPLRATTDPGHRVAGARR